MIRPYASPLKREAGFKVLRGNLFDSAIMKTSVISDEFRARYLSNPGRSRRLRRAAASCSTARRTITPASTTPRSASTRHTLLVIRGAGPIGYPGSAEVVNMQPPAALIKRGITSLPCIGDGRQSGTSGSPSILNASPEAAAGGGLALAAQRRPHPHRSQGGTADMLVSDDGACARRAALEKAGGFKFRRARRRGRKSSAAWWTSLPTAWCSSRRSKYQRVAQKFVCRATAIDANVAIAICRVG